MIDPSIALQVRAPQFDNPLDSYSKFAQVQNAQNQNKLSMLAMQDRERGINDQMALTNAIRSNIDPNTGAINHEGVAAALGQSGSGHLIQDYQNKQLDNRKKLSDIGKTDSETQSKQVGTAKDINQLFGSGAYAILQNPTYENAMRVNNGIRALLPPEMAKKLDGSDIPKDPVELQKWAKSHYLSSIDADKQMQDQTSRDNAKLQSDTSVRTTGMSNNTSIKTTGMTNAVTKRGQDIGAQSAAAGRENALVVAGLGPDGTPGPDSQAMVDAIGNGKIKPPTGMALRNPRMMSIMTQVAQQYPNFDATEFEGRQKAARDFTTGKQGDSIRSFAVAGEHLDQLSSLVTALDNGNVQLINKYGNKLAEATGSVAPTNFDAAKGIVAKEVVKAIVAGGGGVSEREELAHLLDNAKSPKQLQGVIATYKNLMEAQHNGLVRQYENSTGRKDAATRFAYGDKGKSTPSTTKSGATVSNW